MAKTFKTASLAGYGAYGDNADVLRGFVNQNPQLLEQIGGAKALDDYIKQNQSALFWNPETNGEFTFSQQAQDIDKLLQDYQLNSIGYAGMDDGRQKAVVKDGQTLYTGDPYSYKPAKENLETLMRGAAVIGGTAGLSSLVNGGLLGSSAGTGAFDSAGWAGTGIDGATGVSGAAGGGLGATGAFDTAGWAGTGIDGATGMSGAAGGGLLGGLGKAAGTVWDFAKANPKLAGALVGGLLGGSGGSGGSSGGYKYTGPMPTITQGGWKPSVQPNLMQTQSVVQGLPQVQGNQYSGLLRFMGG
jgi:hypothetical protein